MKVILRIFLKRPQINGSENKSVHLFISK